MEDDEEERTEEVSEEALEGTSMSEPAAAEDCEDDVSAAEDESELSSVCSIIQVGTYFCIVT